jgi:O-acetyl-ADP-ribose deacetylase (regulator of RNase III)
MVEFTKGNLFELPVDARVNTVNCQGVMGAGMALAFKNRYPEMFKDYERACRRGEVRPGNLHVWRVAGDWIINFPTKRDWREPSRYEDIGSGLEALRSYLGEQGHISVALPALGCGHGGLDWQRVSSMIKESLSDLDADVFVFQPADSLNAARRDRPKPTDKEVTELEVLGFRPFHLSESEKNDGVPSDVLTKGDRDLLSRRWLALFSSKEPREREVTALAAIARQLGSSANPPPVALVHSTRATQRLAELFRNNGVPVVLILPFGPLTRKSVASGLTGEGANPSLMLSIAGANEPWGRPALAESMKLLKRRAQTILFSDPTPIWLNKKGVRNWSDRPIFYVKYEDVEDAREILEEAGARPIGRRADTGEPNLIPLFKVFPPLKPNVDETGDWDTITSSLTTNTALQLRDLAQALECSPYAEGQVSVTISRKPETEALCSEVRRILRREE